MAQRKDSNRIPGKRVLGHGRDPVGFSKSSRTPRPAEPAVPAAPAYQMAKVAATLLVAGVALLFVGFYAGDAALTAYHHSQGIAATVNGKPIRYSDVAMMPADADARRVAVEDIMNAARRKAIIAHMDEKGVKNPTDADLEAILPSYIGTRTIEAAAEDYSTTAERLREGLILEIRMKNYREEYTGFGEDPPEQPADPLDQAAMAQYQRDLAAFQARSAPSEEKWNALIDEVFSEANIRLYTLSTGR